MVNIENYGYTDYTPSTIGLKITDVPSMAKCISVIRKYNNISMADIKNTIESQGYILSCPGIDTSGIKKIRKCYDELKKNGITSELYQWDEIISRDILSNLLNSHHLTEVQTQAEIDDEIENDD